MSRLESASCSRSVRMLADWRQSLLAYARPWIVIVLELRLSRGKNKAILAIVAWFCIGRTLSSLSRSGLRHDHDLRGAPYWTALAAC